MDYLTVGKIVNTHGLRGELKIKSSTDFDRYKPGNKLAIFSNDNQIAEVTVKSHRIHKEMDLVVFAGYEDINLVEKFKNCYIKIATKDLDELPEDEFYYYELIDLLVYNQDNKYIGKVIEVRELPQGPLLEVKSDNNKIHLIPFNGHFVTEVHDDKLIINEIEGLIS